MATIAKKCSGCRNNLPKKEFMTCSQCNNAYDLLCANISLKRYQLMDQERKNCWKCQECCSKQPKTDNSNTPVRPSAHTVGIDDEIHNISDEQSNVTVRLKKLQSKSDSGDSYVTEDKLRKVLRQDITEIINELVSQKLSSLTCLISDFQDSLSFLSKQYDDLIKSVNEKNTKISSLESKNDSLTLQVTTLTDRLGQVEQQMRSSNLEINGLPEHRTENLLKTMEQLASVVNNPIAENDVLHVTRIAKLIKETDRPRSVIVKLKSQRRRDELLAAVAQYNRKHSSNKLNSEHLGIGGRPVPIFVAEHLTPTNKHLHAATRKKAKEAGYKFVWVRDGRIFVRKNEQCPAICVKDIEKLKVLN